MEAQIKIRARLQTLNCSVAAFAALAAPPMVIRKLSQQQLNQVVNGRVDLDEKEVIEFLSVIDTMPYLQETIKPKLPINWNDPLLVRDVLVHTYKERLDHEDPIVPRSWFVRLSRLNFLQGFRLNNTVIETMNYDQAAAFTDPGLADRCVRRLRDFDITARAELFTTPRRKSMITTSLEEIGFQPESAVVQES